MFANSLNMWQHRWKSNKGVGVGETWEFQETNLDLFNMRETVPTKPWPSHKQETESYPHIKLFKTVSV